MMNPISEVQCDTPHKHGEDEMCGMSKASSEMNRKPTPALEYMHHMADNISSPTVYRILQPRKLKILCLHGFRQNASSFRGRTASLAKKLRNVADFFFIDAPHQLNLVYQPSRMKAEFRHPPPAEKFKKRFAWLIAESNRSSQTDWSIATEPFGPLQYQQQDQGLEKSCNYLKGILQEMGAFDGVLGFSQGAAMAAAFLAVMSNKIDLPFSENDKDRQIGRGMSLELVSAFEENRVFIVEHDLGHIIPTRSPYIDQIRTFLRCFI